MLCACSSSKAPAPIKHDATIAHDATIDAIAIDASTKKTFVTGAGRCGECHGKMYDEWEVSAHAKAASSDIYKKTLAASGDPACDRCHAPLPEGVVRTEGVTCDVCHTLREPVPDAAGAKFRLAIDDMVKYGPRCDLKDHYFHRMGCSPEHREAALCGTCHLWKPNGVPVFTEYEDWKAGPLASMPCQDCHMPKGKAAIATGSPVRTGVPHHGDLGTSGDLRTRALGLEAKVDLDKSRIEVVITLTNANAGHTVPAGLPERRLIVRVRGHEGRAIVSTESHPLGRVLVDAGGKEVPFWKATKVSEDTRIGPHATHQEALSLPGDLTGDLEIEVVERELSPEIAEQLQIAKVDEVLLVQAKVSLAHLPASVKVTPKKVAQ